MVGMHLDWLAEVNKHLYQKCKQKHNISPKFSMHCTMCNIPKWYGMNEIVRGIIIARAVHLIEG